MIAQELAKASPGVAIAALAHVDWGLMRLFLFGSQCLHQTYGTSAVQGKTVMCLGNTENKAGSDAAGISMSADRVDGGWLLNGTKAYVTNGLIAGLGVITAVSDPKAARNKRLSMYLVDLNREGVRRKKIDYIPGSYEKSKGIIFLIYPGIFQQCLLWPLLKDCLKIYPYQPQGASSP